MEGMENIFKLHRDMPRQGPGDNDSTYKTFKKLDIENKDIKVLDIGCGPGMQTIHLAKHINGEITALDFYQGYLDELTTEAKKQGVDYKIKPFNGSMFELSSYFNEKSFDIIWSEGAIYILGFKDGLVATRPLLKDAGYLVVSEVSWLDSSIPSEIKEFWDEHYPIMGSIEENVARAREVGYEVIDTYTLPVESWWKNYYNPLRIRSKKLKLEEPNNTELMKLIDFSEYEMKLFNKYNSSYNYVFYVLKKT